MRGQAELYSLFERLAIQFEYHEHPPLATMKMQGSLGNYNSGRCKTSSFEIIRVTDTI